MLNFFEPSTLQIGDRNYYTLKENDIIMMRDEWKQVDAIKYHAQITGSESDVVEYSKPSEPTNKQQIFVQ
jgi:hypothetical protein